MHVALQRKLIIQSLSDILRNTYAEIDKLIVEISPIPRDVERLNADVQMLGKKKSKTRELSIIAVSIQQLKAPLKERISSIDAIREKPCRDSNPGKGIRSPL